MAKVTNARDADKIATAKTNRKKKAQTVGILLVAVLLFVSGIVATVGYNKFIENTKADGVAEYKLNKCSKHTFEDKSATWLECEPVRVENNQ